MTSGQTKRSNQEDAWVVKKWRTFFKVWGVILLITAVGGCGLGLNAGDGIGQAVNISAFLVGGAIGLLKVTAVLFLNYSQRPH